MRCEDCPNTIYCPEALKEQNLEGCTSGEPIYLPSLVAGHIVSRLKRASERLDIDPEEYLEEVVEEVKKQL